MPKIQNLMGVLTKMTDVKDTSHACESVIVLLDELHPFPNHPFKVIRDDALDALAESIRKNGLLNRIIIRPRDAGGYEIIAGHRRTEAMRMLGHSTIPAELHWDMDDDAAVLAMIETNLRQRPKLLPSERAAAYRMMRDTLVHKGARSDLDNSTPKHTKEQISEMYGESPRQVMRYIRLNHLDTRLVECVDTGKLKLNNAVEISYLNADTQGWIADHYAWEHKFPKPAQVRDMRKLTEGNVLTHETFCELMQEEVLPRADPDDFFDSLREEHFPGLTDADIKQQIRELVQAHFHRKRMGF